MIQFPEIFRDSNQLFLGTNYEYIKEFKTFLHTKSFFNDEWYNFIVPKVERPEMLEEEQEEQIKKVIQEEKQNNVKMSYYIHSKYEKNYINFLNAKGLKNSVQDAFQLYEIESELEIDKLGDFEMSNKYNSEEALSVIQECFPDWENNKEYLMHYEDLKEKNLQDRIFETLVIKDSSGSILSVAFFVVDKEINLAYYHNAGTIEAARRKGFQKNLLKAGVNFTHENGVTRLFALTEPESISFLNLQKLGFSEEARFTLFY